MTQLEDRFNDILAKAQNGLGLSNEEICRSSGISSDLWRKLKAGRVHLEALRNVSKVLGLAEEPLIQIAENKWMPQKVTLPRNVRFFCTPYHDMMVNNYLVWDEELRRAAAFDTGTDAGEMLAVIASENLTLEYLFLTHSHGDHIFEMDRIAEKTKARVLIGDREPLEGAEPFHHGDVFYCGGLKIETRLTYGHSPGGITYVISGLPIPLAVVGDALFAGSMGGGRFNYLAALATGRSEILTLPEDTVLCSGHGPLTTLREEKKSNPFFCPCKR